MTTYERRPIDAASEAHADAINAAARLAEHDEECGCQATGFEPHGHFQFHGLLDAAAVAKLRTYEYSDPFGAKLPIRLYRDGVLVAQWRTL